jgi:outer membrane lipoprotein-sorting protein
MLSSCSSSPKDSAVNSQANDQTVSSTPPFQTKEPQHYQAVRTITFTDPAGNSVTRKITIARSELFRREDTENTGAGTIVSLELDKGRFVVIPNLKIYSEISDTSDIDPTDFESSPERLLHLDTFPTTYQKLGSDVVSGRKTTKYRVGVNTSTGTNVTSNDTLIWVDEALGMPIKSETTGSDGSHVVMELSNIALEVDMNLFRIPEGYEKVTANALRQRLSQKPSQLP